MDGRRIKLPQVGAATCRGEDVKRAEINTRSQALVPSASETDADNPGKHERNVMRAELTLVARSTLLTLLSGIIIFAVALDSVAEDWPRWRGPRGDGTWQGPKLPQAWPAEGLPVRWRQPIAGGYAGVIVSGGRVYVMDRMPVEEGTAGDEVERLHCFSAAEGRPLWVHQNPVVYGDLDYGSGPRAAPTVFDGRVYTLGAMGHLWCLEAVSGEPQWSHDLVEQGLTKIPEWGLAASPVIWKNLVIVHPGGQPDACFIAFDRMTGELIWNCGSDPAGYATPIVIGSGTQQQLVCWSPLNVLGIAPADGTIQWSIPYEVTYGVSIATPIYHRGLVFVSGYWEGSKTIDPGLDSAAAELVWEDRRSLRGLMSQPLSRDGYVYLLDKSLGLTCFEMATGEIQWDDRKHQMTPRGRNPQATLVWTGEEDRVLVLNSEGELILARLNPAGYHEQSRTKIIGPTWAHPAYAESSVYARDDNEIVAVSLPVVEAQE